MAWYNISMPNRKYEVILEKVERVRVVVDASDAESAGLIAEEFERRGDIDSVDEISMSVMGCCDL